MPDLHEERVALIPALAAKTSGGQMGRTALMKYMYFLQALRNLQLGYRFTLYSYGPFDSDVLADLGTAEDIGAVESEAVSYPGGYGYKIKPGSKAEWLQRRASKFLNNHKADVLWVTGKFGSYSSAQLELVSTIIYVDREAARKKERIKLQNLAQRVQQIKPHFREAHILSFAEQLAGDKLLKATR